MATESALGATHLVVDLGDSPVTTDGDYLECFGGPPDQVSHELCAIGNPASSAWKLCIADHAPSNQVGAEIPLGKALRSAFSAGDQPTHGSLLMRVAGNLGRRRLRVELRFTVDADLQSTHAGFLDFSTIDSEGWQDVSFAIPNRVWRNLESLRLVAEGTGTAWLAVDRICATTDQQPANPTTYETDRPRVPLRKALWVWQTDQLLPYPEQHRKLLRFCEQQEISDLFLQAPYAFENHEVKMRFVDEQRSFNTAAHALAIQVHLLDGSPQYVLRANHSRMTALLDTVGSFNRQATREERYDAVHLDNEPYLLAGWKDDDSRQAILDDYVELNQALGKKAKQLGVAFGLDIPFWFDVLGANGEPRFWYLADGERIPLLEALFACVDNVGVMAYRPRVLGANGVLAHCQHELQLGAAMHVEVFVAVELGKDANVEAGTTFGPYSADYFQGQYRTLQHVLSCRKGPSGIAIHHYPAFVTLLEKR